METPWPLLKNLAAGDIERSALVDKAHVSLVIARVSVKPPSTGSLSVAQLQELAEQIVSAATAAPEMAELLERVKRDLVGYALQKFDWGRSALDADAIRHLNEIPLAVDALLSRLRTEGGV